MADGDTTLALLLQQATELAVPVVGLGEFQYGIPRAHHRRRYQSRSGHLIPGDDI